MGWSVTNSGVQTQVIGADRTVTSGWTITVMTDAGKELMVTVTDAEYRNPDTVKAKIAEVVAANTAVKGLTG